MKFTATKNQIETAQLLFIAMAFRDTVQKEFEKWETEILSSSNYYYADHYYTGNPQKGGLELPEDKILRDRTHIFCINGLNLLDTPEYQNTDACRFYSQLRKKAITAGFKNGENAACMADNEVIRLQNQMIDVTYNIHKTKREDIVYLSHRKQLVELLLGLFARLVKNEHLERLKIQFYNERVSSINFSLN
jgi:hypothetical protein